MGTVVEQGHNRKGQEKTLDFYLIQGLVDVFQLMAPANGYVFYKPVTFGAPLCHALPVCIQNRRDVPQETADVVSRAIAAYTMQIGQLPQDIVIGAGGVWLAGTPPFPACRHLL
jgi:hypothetical protein